MRLSGSQPVAFDIPGATATGRGDRRPRGAGDTGAEEPRLHGVAPLRARAGGLLTTWSLKAPNEVEYRIKGGADAIVLGTRRWDRDRAGRAVAALAAASGARVPQPAWGSRATNAYVLGTGGWRPAGLGRLLRQPDHAGLVHGLDRPAHATARCACT